MENIIINADDFGLNSSANKAIVESFDNGYINSTTIMSNMPGFDEAIELAHKHKLMGKIGIHLNLTEGNPLIKNNEFLCLLFNTTNLKKKKRRLFFLSKEEKKIIFKELSSQIEKVQNNGIEITHIDTHHHAHEVWPITQIILDLSRTYHIRSIRILNNLNSSTSSYKNFYRNFVNGRIKLKDKNYSDFFGNQLQTFSHFKVNPSFCKSKKLEIMVHPDYNNGILIDKINGKEYDFVNIEYLINNLI